MRSLQVLCFLCLPAMTSWTVSYTHLDVYKRQLYKVTNLEDYGSGETPIKGSLRYGIEQVEGPRTIVFDVDGIIELKRCV